jgi:O-antigen/teichoic acid export membrane protein
MTKQEEHVAVTQQQQGDSNLAIVSMVLGVVSLTGPGLLLGIPAIITSSIALKRKLAGRGLAIAGLVTGIVSTVFSLLFCIFMAFLIMWSIAHPEQTRDSQSPSDNWSTHEDMPYGQSQT